MGQPLINGSGGTLSNGSYFHHPLSVYPIQTLSYHWAHPMEKIIFSSSSLCGADNILNLILVDFSIRSELAIRQQGRVFSYCSPIMCPLQTQGASHLIDDISFLTYKRSSLSQKVMKWVIYYTNDSTLIQWAHSILQWIQSFT